MNAIFDQVVLTGFHQRRPETKKFLALLLFFLATPQMSAFADSGSMEAGLVLTFGALIWLISKIWPFLLIVLCLWSFYSTIKDIVKDAIKDVIKEMLPHLYDTDKFKDLIAQAIREKAGREYAEKQLSNRTIIYIVILKHIAEEWSVSAILKDLECSKDSVDMPPDYSQDYRDFVKKLWWATKRAGTDFQKIDGEVFRDQLFEDACLRMSDYRHSEFNIQFARERIIEAQSEFKKTLETKKRA